MRDARQRQTSLHEIENYRSPLSLRNFPEADAPAVKSSPEGSYRNPGTTRQLLATASEKTGHDLVGPCDTRTTLSHPRSPSRVAIVARDGNDYGLQRAAKTPKLYVTLRLLLVRLQGSQRRCRRPCRRRYMRPSRLRRRMEMALSTTPPAGSSSLYRKTRADLQMDPVASIRYVR